MKFTFTTFNLENLFNRYSFLDTPWEERDYEKFVQAVGIASIADRKGSLVSYDITEIQRNNTALSILDCYPDILAVQEVENLYTLRIFNDTYLDKYFDRMLLIDGNDPRGIDVGLLVRHGFDCEILCIRTHIHDGIDGKTVTYSSRQNFGYVTQNAIFSRDCLEVDLKINNKVFTILINHLKAKDSDIKKSDYRRLLQAEKVAAIAQQAADNGKLPIVVGDFNAEPSSSTLVPILKSPLLQDPFKDLKENDAWTHYYSSGRKISRLDYILPHKNITVNNTYIHRKGLTTKCKDYVGYRYPTIGPEHTEASDHCPVSVMMEV
jgi:endonuclease/exonuclease/phosphatase family metal-dependent hydrolase